MNRLFVSACALAALVATPAGAAVQLVNGSGQLTGGTGVVVNGTSYDVSFAEGSCASLFGGCATAANLNFTSEADAQAAALALLQQLLLDTGAGQFDTDYTLTFGCGTNNATACAVLIPFATNGIGTAVAQALNTPAQDTNLVNAAPGVDFDTTGSPNYVYALFTPSAAAVPEPATWTMMLLGFAGMGLAVRRRRTAAAA